MPTCEYKTSRDLATVSPIFANLVSKDAQDLKEKSHEKACREAVVDFVQGGVKLTPPPVKIGLSQTSQCGLWGAVVMDPRNVVHAM